MSTLKGNNYNKEKVLREINQEIQAVYEFCLKNGYSNEEIRKAAKPILEPLRRIKIEKRIVSLVKITFVLIVILTLFSVDPVYQRLWMYGRLFLFQLLPFWDWTKIYHYSCLVDNPLFSINKITESDCQICKDLVEIKRCNQTSQDEITEHFLKHDIPLIVMESTNNWSITEESFSIANLSEGYLDDFRLNRFGVCMFQTNLRFRTPQTFLHNLKTNPKMDQWYVHWNNCGKAAQKFLRKFYLRPYFLPPMFEMMHSNWILMSFNYKGYFYKKVDVVASTCVIWLAQVRGYNHIRLRPRNPCNNFCGNLEDVLKEGDTLLFPVKLWKIEYLPGENSKNLAIAVGSFFQ